MTADSDYQRVLNVFAYQRLPAYVSYVDTVTLHGARYDSGNTHGPQRVTVNTKTRQIVEGSPSLVYAGNDKTNPVVNPAFDPKCYRATNETRASYNARDSVLFTLKPTCGSHDEYFFTELYADATTMQPLAADGTFIDREMGGGARADIEQSYGVFGGYVMPALLNVNVKGTGIVFWLRVHAEETYTDYRFEDSRRQSH